MTELYDTVAHREKRVIAAALHINARLKPGPSLSYDYTSRRNHLAAITLYAQTLRMAVAAVT